MNTVIDFINTNSTLLSWAILIGGLIYGFYAAMKRDPNGLPESLSAWLQNAVAREQLLHIVQSVMGDAKLTDAERREKAVGMLKDWAQKKLGMVIGTAAANALIEIGLNILKARGLGSTPTITAKAAH